MFKSKTLFLCLMAVLVAGFALGSEAIPNWSAPATWTPASSGGVHTMDLSNPLPFIPIAPCRVADTRGNGFVGAYGPPSLVANANRNFTITGQCGIPNTAAAVSFNFGALNVASAGDLRVFPAGGGLPLVSTLNYNGSTPNIANAAVVPLGGGAITVRADAVSIDLIIDVNGYYYDYFSGSGILNSGEQWLIKTSTASASGLYGENTSSSVSSRGIRGLASGTGGTVYGVWGETASTATHSGGLLGTDGASVVSPGNFWSFSTGVIGDGRNGVVGETSTVGGFAVGGFAQSTAGAITGCGVVGQGTNAFHAYVGAISCATCTMTLVDPHPTDASKELRFVSPVGNEAGTYFRGTAQTDGKEFVIDVPEDFRMVTDAEGLTVQLTPIGMPASMWVVSEDLNQIVVRSSRDVRFHYLVQGVRPAFKDFKTVGDTSSFLPQTADARIQDGWPEWTKQRLIANGTYNPDGTVNMATAERLGWAKTWRERDQQMKIDAVAFQAREAATSPK